MAIAFLGDKSNAALPTPSRTISRHVTTIDADHIPAAPGPFAGQGLHQLVLPIPGNACDAKNFASARGEGQAAKRCRESCCRGTVKAAHLEQNVRLTVRPCLTVDVADRTANHHLGELLAALAGRVDGSDIAAAAQYRGPPCQ